MPSLKFDIIVDGSKGKIAMEQFANETDAAFRKTERAVKRISLAALPEHEQAVVRVQRRYEALGNEIKKLEKVGRITKEQANVWRAGLTGNMEKEIAGIGNASKNSAESFSTLTGNILKSAPAFAVATAAIAGVYGAFRLLGDEIKMGLSSVEDYKMNVIKLAATMTNFSHKAQEGDISGAWKESLSYSRQLVQDLEILDARSAASGKNIVDMVSTLASFGVMVDTNVAKQKDAVVALANAIKMLTAGQQNQEMQFAQEIRGLMEGVVKPGSLLVGLMKNAGLDAKVFADEIRSGKKTIADILPYISGFEAATGELENTWTTIGSTLETIHTRVLRGGFEPAMEDILKWAKELSAYYMDSNGILTEQGILLQEKIKSSWEDIKSVVVPVYNSVSNLYGLLVDISNLADKLPTIRVLNYIYDKIGGAALGSIEYINSALDKLDSRGSSLDYMGKSHGASISAPLLFHKPTEAELDAIRKAKEEAKMLAAQWDKTKLSLSDEMALIGLSDLDKSLATIAFKARDMRGQFGDRKDIDKWVESMSNATIAAHNLKEAMGMQDNVSSLFEAELGRREEEAKLLADFTIHNMQELDLLLIGNEQVAAGISEFWKEAFSDMQSFSKDFFFDLMKGNLDDLGERFSDMILNMIANWQAAQLQMALWGSDQSASGGLGNGLISAGVNWVGGMFHSGGVVGSGGLPIVAPSTLWNNAPRFHNGLAGDEFPAILQRGETVIPRGGGAIGDVTVNVYNQGGEQKQATSKVKFDVRGIVVDVFLQDMAQNGPMRRSMAGGL